MPMHARAAQSDQPDRSDFTLWVGGYAPNCRGMQAFSFAPPRLGDSAPAVRALGVEVHADSPSYLCVDPAQPGRLYALHETTHRLSTYQQVQAGRLQHLATQPSGGLGPVHMSLYSHACWRAPLAFIAHYGSAEVAVFAREEGCALKPLSSERSWGARAAACTSHEDARPGPQRAERGPPASFAHSGHDAPHVHMVQVDPSGRWLFATDLGRDHLLRWPLGTPRGSTEAGAAQLLLENPPPAPDDLARPAPAAVLGERQDLPLSPGGGPRHFVFHPKDPRQLYVLTEEASTLIWLRWDAASGGLQVREEISALPVGFAGTSFASDLLCCAEGRFLYALNRLHDSIAIFSLAADGRPMLREHVWARGSYPRNALLSPDGRWLLVANQRSDHLTVFERDGRQGELRFTGQYLASASPAGMALLQG